MQSRFKQNGFTFRNPVDGPVAEVRRPPGNTPPIGSPDSEASRLERHRSRLRPPSNAQSQFARPHVLLVYTMPEGQSMMMPVPTCSQSLATTFGMALHP